MRSSPDTKGSASARPRSVVRTPRHEFRRREGLYDVVGRARLERPGDGLVPAVGRDEDDRQAGEFGVLLHQFDAVGARKQQVEQDKGGLLDPDQARQLRRVAPSPAARTPPVTAHGERSAASADRRRPRGCGCARALSAIRSKIRGPGQPESPPITGTVKVKRAPCPGPRALRADAPSVRLHQPLADGQAQTVAHRFVLPAAAGALPEQERQPLRRHAPALVGHRDGYVPRRHASPRPGW